GAPVRALRSASFTLEQGETLGIVGESGCGKTTLGLALLGMLPDSATVTGEFRFEGRNLVGLSKGERRALAWRRIAYVPQSAMNSLDPTAPLWRQFQRIWLAHGAGTSAEGMKMAQSLFRQVELDEKWLSAYPHEL